MAKLTLREFYAISSGLVLGIALDFLLNGVFKIIWLVIYLPVYCVAAIGFDNGLSKTRWKDLKSKAVISLFAGAALGHLFFTAHHKTYSYTMLIAGQVPITLYSQSWPQKLIVSSEKLTQKLVGARAGESIVVTVDQVTNYGCIESNRVQTVDGIDVRNDPVASWTWRTEAGVSPQDGPGTEDHGFPWCKIQFYR